MSVDTLLLAQGFRGPYIRDKEVAASKSPKAASYPPAFRARMQIQNITKTRQSKQCGFSIYTFDNLKSKSMVRLVRAEKIVLSGLVFARKIARMILIQNI